MISHPKSRAERRRLKRKKEYIDQDREGDVQRRLAEEALEQKEALDVLRREVLPEIEDWKDYY